MPTVNAEGLETGPRVAMEELSARQAAMCLRIGRGTVGVRPSACSEISIKESVPGALHICTHLAESMSRPASITKMSAEMAGMSHRKNQNAADNNKNNAGVHR